MPLHLRNPWSCRSRHANLARSALPSKKASRALEGHIVLQEALPRKHAPKVHSVQQVPLLLPRAVQDIIATPTRLSQPNVMLALFAPVDLPSQGYVRNATFARTMVQPRNPAQRGTFVLRRPPHQALAWPDSTAPPKLVFQDRAHPDTFVLLDPTAPVHALAASIVRRPLTQP
jgi:hypothetical protein